MEEKKEQAWYIVRCKNSGVFFGHIKERNGREVTLTDVRRLWRWYGAYELLELSQEGTEYPDDCKFTVAVPEIVVLDAIELDPCSEKAAASILGVPVWKMNR